MCMKLKSLAKIDMDLYVDYIFDNLLHLLHVCNKIFPYLDPEPWCDASTFYSNS